MSAIAVMPLALVIVGDWLVQLMSAQQPRVMLCLRWAMHFLQPAGLSNKAVKEVYVALHMLHRTIEKQNYPPIIKC